MAEHGVHLNQTVYGLLQFLEGDSHFLSEFLNCGIFVRHELVQRWIRSRTVTGSPCMTLKISLKSPF